MDTLKKYMDGAVGLVWVLFCYALLCGIAMLYSQARLSCGGHGSGNYSTNDSPSRDMQRN